MPPAHDYHWDNNPWLARVFLVLGRTRLRKVARLWGSLLGIDAPGPLPRSLNLPHPYGIVISARVRFGEDCVVYQGVTIGVDDLGGVPSIGDRVEIYPGACIFGDVRLGESCRIGANSVVFCDVPAGATAVGVPARIVPSRPTSVPVSPPTSPSIRDEGHS